MIADSPQQITPSQDDVTVLPLQNLLEAHNAAFNSYQAGQFSVIEAAGEIDLAGAPEMRDFLGAAGSTHVVFDLRQVTFIDASGLGVLAKAWRMAEVSGGSVKLVAPSMRLRRLLAITRLDTVLPVYDTVGEAIG